MMFSVREVRWLRIFLFVVLLLGGNLFLSYEEDRFNSQSDPQGLPLVLFGK